MKTDTYKSTYQKYLNFIDKYKIAINASSGSEVDANANVEQKNVTTMAGELFKKEAIGTNRLLMINKITSLYGDDMAKEYIRQLESHEIYKHDETSLSPYCVSITMYPFLFDGMEGLGGMSSAPKNLNSFLGSFINLVFAVAAQFAGAVSTPEFLTYMDYFLRLDYGDDYYLRADDVVSSNNRHSTINSIIDASFQQAVYSLNSPAAARNLQSVFWNIAYFDKPYFHGIFDGFYFPDGSEPKWDSVNWLQKRFMKWFNKERLKKVLTFPVETVNLLDNGADYVDQEWKNFTAEMYAEGHSFFTYRSGSVDSLSSCCYSGDTKVLVKDSDGAYLMPFSEIESHKFAPNGFKIFNNGKWSSGRLIKLQNRDMYKVTTAMNKVFCATDNHRNNCLGGMKTTENLTENDYIMLNGTPLDTYPEKDEGLTYEQGFTVGAFLGDGSFGSTFTLSDGTKQIYETVFSLSAGKLWIIDLLNDANKKLGNLNSLRVSEEDNHVFSAKVSSKEMVTFITRWTNWERGTKSNTKTINIDCLLQSADFRQGIVDGWYATDGNLNSIRSGESLRGYTTSLNLLEKMDAICTSLGYITSISIDNRMENPVFRGVEYEKNSPVYCLLRFKKDKHSKVRKDVCVFRDNSYYARIKSVEKVQYDGCVYCFEMDDPSDDKFTLPNGIHNFNCRLRNEIQENTFSFTLGAGGVSTGSKGVITININRLVQNAVKENIDIEDKVREQVEKIHKYLIAFNEIMMDNYNARLLPVYDAGFISMKKQYLTIGINGFVEGAEFLGIDITPNNAYFQYGEKILKPIYDTNRAARTGELMFNTEFVPAENLGVKNAKWDVEDGYVVPRDCYNSYFYRVETDDTNILDKFILHGGRLTKYLDGGSALHANCQEHLTKKQYLKMLDVMIKTGCSYSTFNIPNTVCNECGFITKHRVCECPRCGSTNLDYITRIIGYLKRVSAFSDARQKEESKRLYENGRSQVQ